MPVSRLSRRVAEPHLLGADADRDLPGCAVHVRLDRAFRPRARPGPVPRPCPRAGCRCRGTRPRTTSAAARTARSGVPSCSILPARMTAIWSAIVIASSWSCVTWTNVIPTSYWMPLQLELHLLSELQVERAERLVEEQHLRPVHERARERDPLLLAAGELPRLPLAERARGRRARGRRRPASSARRPSRPCGAGRTRRSRGSSGAGRARSFGTPCSRRACTAAGRRCRCRRGRIRPAVGSSKPPIMRSVVVLPQPDGPSRAKKLPCSISSEMSSTAGASSKIFVTRSSLTDPGSLTRRLLPLLVHRVRPAPPSRSCA